MSQHLPDPRPLVRLLGPKDPARSGLLRQGEVIITGGRWIRIHIHIYMSLLREN